MQQQQSFFQSMVGRCIVDVSLCQIKTQTYYSEEKATYYFSNSNRCIDILHFIGVVASIHDSSWEWTDSTEHITSNILEKENIQKQVYYDVYALLKSPFQLDLLVLHKVQDFNAITYWMTSVIYTSLQSPLKESSQRPRSPVLEQGLDSYEEKQERAQLVPVAKQNIKTLALYTTEPSIPTNKKKSKRKKN